ncbi:MAG: DUF1634 domain-containing protein [Granulicella sp.]
MSEPLVNLPDHIRSEDDRRMETLMGRLLQIGVLVASAFVLLGGILYLREHLGTVVGYGLFKSQPPELRHAKTLLTALAHLRPEAIIQLGVLMLIATPIARVIFAAFAFALERDRLYLVISLVVLGVLVFGLHAS